MSRFLKIYKTYKNDKNENTTFEDSEYSFFQMVKIYERIKKNITSLFINRVYRKYKVSRNHNCNNNGGECLKVFEIHKLPAFNYIEAIIKICEDYNDNCEIIFNSCI